MRLPGHIIIISKYFVEKIVQGGEGSLKKTGRKYCTVDS